MCEALSSPDVLFPLFTIVPFFSLLNRMVPGVFNCQYIDCISVIRHTYVAVRIIGIFLPNQQGLVEACIHVLTAPESRWTP